MLYVWADQQAGQSTEHEEPQAVKFLSRNLIS